MRLFSVKPSFFKYILPVLLAVFSELLSKNTAFADTLPPKIVILQPVYDFGTIAQGTIVTHDFEVLNEGGSDLVIQQVVPACGCTAAVAKESTVTPGGKTIIHVEFDSTGFSGSKTKAARVNSNDPITPSATITMQGVIEDELSYEPARLLFDQFVVSADIPLPELRLVVKSKGTAAITDIKPGSRSLEIRVVKSSATEWDVYVKPSATIVLGDIRDRIIISITKGNQKRETSVPVIGKVVGPISLRPSSVAMGIIAGDAPLERRIQLETRLSKQFKIKSIESDNKAVTVTQKPIDAGKVAVLIVSVNPKLLSSDLKSIVTITFDNPELSPIQFSVYGVRPPKVE